MPALLVPSVRKVFSIQLFCVLAHLAIGTSEIEISTKDVEWTKVNNVGTWFPDAFLNTMSSLQRFALGEDKSLPHSVDNSFNTMAVVYACLESSHNPGTSIKY